MPDPTSCLVAQTLLMKPNSVECVMSLKQESTIARALFLAEVPWCHELKIWVDQFCPLGT